MARRFVIGMVLVLVFGVGGGRPAVQELPLLAIAGVTIVDGTGAQPFVGTVTVRGDRIAQIERGTTPPSGARVIDGTGKTLLPGLFDLHTHVQASPAGGSSGDWPKHLMAYLYAGVTSIADLGSYSENFDSVRQLLRDGTIQGPRIAMASRVSSPGGHGAESGRPHVHTREIQTSREARAALEEILAGPRPDLIKAFSDGWRYGTAPDMTSLLPDTLTTVVEEAHRAGIPVISHTVTVAKAKMAARAGVDIIGHGIGDEEVDPELIDLMRKSQTVYAPTLSVYAPSSGVPETPLLDEVLDPSARRVMERRRQETGTRSAESDERAAKARQRRWSNLRRNTALLRDGGVRFGLGTDAGMPSTFHGAAPLRELLLLVDAGLTPLEALTAATGNSARALRVDTERGTIQPGKLADLILVDGRPHESIADITRIHAVFLGGREIDRAKLKQTIATDGPTPLPSSTVTATAIDDFERQDGRAFSGQLWVDYADSGHDRSRLSWTRTLRSATDHSMLVYAQLGEKDRPFTRLTLPFSGGGLLPVDAQAFQGVQFEVRGEGAYQLLVSTQAGRGESAPMRADFSAGPAWTTVRIPFSKLKRETAASAEWRGDELLSLAFELTGNGGQQRWMEVDNVAFYR
jgi:imidazolonepropionase-like amidohydrolase